MKDMTGSLSKNAKKEKPSQPDLRGKASIGGVDFWISAWTKTGENGDKWLSLAFEAKSDSQVRAERAAPAVKAEDDIPW